MRKITLLLILLLFTLSAKAQKEIEIVFAQESEFFSKPIPTRIAKGEVHLIHNGTHLFCDSVLLYELENEFKAYGNVMLQRGDSIDLVCDSLLYLGNEDLTKAFGDVVLRKDTVYLKTEELSYEITKEEAFYDKNGIIINEEDEITSQIGRFIFKENKVEFEKKVVVLNKDFTSNSEYMEYNTVSKDIIQKDDVFIKTDSSDIKMDFSFFDYDQQLVYASGNVLANYSEYQINCDSLQMFTTDSVLFAWEDIFIYNKEDKSELYSQHAYLNKIEKEGYCTDEVLMIQPEKTGDTTFLKSDSLYFYNNDGLYLIGFDNTKLFKTSVQAISDSLFLIRNKEELYLYKAPLCWMENQQVSADSMKIDMLEQEVDSVFLEGHVFLIQEEDSIRRLFSQLKGRKMDLNMDNKEMESAWVFGNVEVLFCIKEENQITGLNNMLGAELDIKFKDSEINKIKMSQNIEAKMIPLQEINEKNKFLANFSWFKEKRPKRFDF
jgi:lipopolysaccharide assembly outer membrane protein LptD (OstA)